MEDISDIFSNFIIQGYMYKLFTNYHSTFSLYYHLIFTTKYRKNIFINNDIIISLKEIFFNISNKHSVYIEEIETDKNHVHLLIRCTPTICFPKYIKNLKGTSSRILRLKYVFINNIIWKEGLWSKSYFLATTGNVTIEILKQYIQNQ